MFYNEKSGLHLTFLFTKLHKAFSKDSLWLLTAANHLDDGLRGSLSFYGVMYISAHMGRTHGINSTSIRGPVRWDVSSCGSPHWPMDGMGLCWRALPMWPSLLPECSGWSTLPCDWEFPMIFSVEETTHDRSEQWTARLSVNSSLSQNTVKKDTKLL